MRLKFIFPALALVLLLSSLPPAYAQIDEIEQANVPFDFYAGSTKMPAGNYKIGLDEQTNIIEISNASGKNGVLLLGSPAAGTATKTQLVFDHSGDNYLLREIDNSLLNLSVSKDKSAKDSGAESSRVNVTGN